MIQEIGVDVVGLVDFADFIFKDGVELSFPEFMEIVLQLRGSNMSTVRDVVDLRKFMFNQMRDNADHIEKKVLTAIKGLSRELQASSEHQGPPPEPPQPGVPEPAHTRFGHH